MALSVALACVSMALLSFTGLLYRALLACIPEHGARAFVRRPSAVEVTPAHLENVACELDILEGKVVDEGLRRRRAAAVSGLSLPLPLSLSLSLSLLLSLCLSLSLSLSVSEPVSVSVSVPVVVPVSVPVSVSQGLRRRRATVSSHSLSGLMPGFTAPLIIPAGS